MNRRLRSHTNGSVNRPGTGEVRWGWSHEAAEFFEYGTSAHTIDGDPVLSFVWEDPPAEIREQFSQARDAQGRFTGGVRVFFSSVHVSGIEETRYARHGLEWLAREAVRQDIA